MKWLPAILLVTTLALLPACEDTMDCDDCCDPCPPRTPWGFLSLTSRSAVLNNIEVAYAKRLSYRIDELLDADFVFYFDESDVGGEIPESWDRNTEMATTDALFTSNVAPNPTGPVCRQIRVDLVFNKKAMIWTETIPVSYPDETWYATTVNYTFTFQMEGDITYIQNNAKAMFVVRPVGDEWRLVEWHDLGAPTVPSSAAGSSETKNWGAIKSLYQ